MALRKRRTGLRPLAFTSTLAASQLDNPEVIEFSVTGLHGTNTTVF